MKEITNKYRLSKATHRVCPRCEKCVHQTIEYGAYVHKWVVSCNAKVCDYKKKGDEQDE